MANAPLKFSVSEGGGAGVVVGVVGLESPHPRNSKLPRTATMRAVIIIWCGERAPGTPVRKQLDYQDSPPEINRNPRSAASTVICSGLRCTPAATRGPAVDGVDA